MSGGDFFGGAPRDTIFLLVRPAAEPVLEIDAQVFDRLACELGMQPGMDAGGEYGRQLERCGKGGGVGSVLCQRLARERAQFHGRVCREQVSSAVERMDRLTVFGSLQGG